MAKKKETKKQEVQKPNDTLVKTFLATALVALPLGYFVGAAVADNDDTDTDMSIMETDSHDDADADKSRETAHAHDTLEVPFADAPVIAGFTVSKDSKDGWNIYVNPDNFVFDPENAGGEHVDGRGHAHVYVDGVKIGRMYGSYFHVSGVDQNEAHTIRVTLNTNDHKDYAVNGQVVAVSQAVGGEEHSHDDDGEGEAGHNH